MTRLEPRVGLGLPVYNGENFMAEAIGSVLGQTFTDFELVISDNASTDGTEAIARDFAARDRRIRYVRNPRNLGAAANFDNAFALARGGYFRWLAHDDVAAPTHLERCVAALDADPGAVLCQSDARFIDADGAIIPDDKVAERIVVPTVEAATPSARFREAIRFFHSCFDSFALIRREHLARTELHGAYHASDRVLIAELALRGRFARVNEPLLFVRDHPRRFTRDANKNRELSREWYLGTREGVWRTWRGWPVLAGYGRALRRADLSPAERLRCRAHLLRWAADGFNARRLAVDGLAWALGPRADDAARALAHALRREGGARRSPVLDRPRLDGTSGEAR